MKYPGDAVVSGTAPAPESGGQPLVTGYMTVTNFFLIVVLAELGS